MRSPPAALRGTAQHGLGDGLEEQLEMRSSEVWLKRHYCYNPPLPSDADMNYTHITLGKIFFQAALQPNNDD